MYVRRNGELLHLVDKQGVSQPWLMQPGDIVCDAYGTPLRDRRNRRYDR